MPTRSIPPQLERATRLKCRDLFKAKKLLPRIAHDLQELLGIDEGMEEFAADYDPALPAPLWTPAAE